MLAKLIVESKPALDKSPRKDDAKTSIPIVISAFCLSWIEWKSALRQLTKFPSGPMSIQ